MNTKLQRIKETLKSVLSQFQTERITSDKGVLDIQKAGDEIAVGDTAVIVDEEGVESQAESGEYLLTDNRVLVIEDGKITEIKDKKEEEPAEEEQPEEENAEKESFMKQKGEFEESYDEKTRKIADAIRSMGFDAWVVEAADDYAIVEVWADGGVKHYRFAISWDEEGNAVVGEMTEVEQEYVPVEEEKPVEPAPEEPAAEEEPAEENFEEVEDPSNEGEESDTEAVVKLREEVNEFKRIVDELKKRLDEIEKKPAAEPATEEFAKVNKLGKTGNEKLDRLAKLMGA